MLPMDKLKIIKDSPGSLNMLELIDEQEKANDETKEVISVPYPSNFKQKLASGAITFFLTFSLGSSTVKLQEIFTETPSGERILSDIVKSTDILREIEKDIEMVSAPRKLNLEKLIDGDEIQEEMEIISNYMSNVKKYYETRKKRFKI